MANTTTLANIRTRVRERCDMENSNFISSTELLSFINASYGEFYEIIVSRFEDYFVEDSDFTLASGVSTYTLPTDFFKFRGLDRELGGGEYQTLTKFNFAERNSVNRNYRRLSAYPYSIQYRIVGDEIRIVPKSSAAGDYKLWYVPVFTPLVSESDTVDGYNGWEEYIIIDASIKCLAKEESSTTEFVAEKKAILKRIEDMASNRDFYQPEKITDVNQTDGWMGLV